MLKNQSNNKKVLNMFWRFCIICGLCVGSYIMGLNTKYDKSDVIKAKDEIIVNLNQKYENLSKEHTRNKKIDSRIK